MIVLIFLRSVYRSVIIWKKKKHIYFLIVCLVFFSFSFFIETFDKVMKTDIWKIVCPKHQFLKFFQHRHDQTCASVSPVQSVNCSLTPFVFQVIWRVIRTAIVCYPDIIAAQGQYTAVQMGTSVPEPWLVSVLGTLLYIY